MPHAKLYGQAFHLVFHPYLAGMESLSQQLILNKLSYRSRISYLTNYHPTLNGQPNVFPSLFLVALDNPACN